MAVDPVARGLGARAQPNGPVVNRKLLIDNLLTRARRARFDNPQTRGLMAAGDKPSVSSSTTAPTTSSTTTQRVPNAATTSADYAPYIALNGGWPIISSNTIYAPSMTKTLGAATGGSNSSAYQATTRAVFYTDDPAPVFGLACVTALTPWRLIVDGKYYDLAGFTNGALSTTYYWTLDFSAAGGRKVRRIEIEMQGGPSSGSFGVQLFGRLYVSQKSRIWAPPEDETGPRAILFGDSYTFGPIAGHTTTSMLGDGLARIAGDYLGLDDVWCSGLSGEGYMWGSSSDAGPTAVERVTDITSWSPDLLVVLLGVNDIIQHGQTARAGAISAANAQTAARTFLSTVRAAKPYLPIVVFGPWRTAGSTVRTNHASYDNAIRDAVAALDDDFIQFVSTQGVQTGTGYVGSLTNDGNGDVYLCSDATHPTDRTNATGDGHAYLGRFVAKGVLDSLTTMAAAA